MTSITRLLLPSAAIALIAAACGGTTNSATSGEVDPNTEAGTGTAASGMPCDVANALAKCTSCHSNPPIGGATVPLVTRDDVMAPLPSDPSKTVGQRALERMADTTSPMPPKPADPATDAEIAAVKAWVDGGMTKGTCGDAVTPVPSPYDTPVTCTSGKKWTLGERGSSLMHPGGACITCHAKNSFEAPRFAVAGTVYPSAHEPDDCNSTIAGGGAQVVITDANKKVYTLNVNTSGNFYYEDRTGTFKKPYNAKVVYQGRERAMSAAQTDGDCNKCHTQDGAEKAPGRIMLP